MVNATYAYQVPDGSNINVENDGRLTITKDGARLLTIIDHKRNESAGVDENNDDMPLTVLGPDPYFILNNMLNNIIEPPENKIPSEAFYLSDLFGSHVQNAYCDGIDGLKNFTAYWNVPTSPKSCGRDANIYLWSGVQNEEDTDVLQPVLAYTAAAGWMCMAVCGINGHFICSDPIGASTGDSIMGIVNRGPRYWSASIFNLSTGLACSITATGISDLTSKAAIVCELEVYGVNTCDHMPGDTEFSNISVTDADSKNIDITWTTSVTPGWAYNMPGLSVSTPSNNTVLLNTAN
jgi:hypothetical protein